MSKFKIIACKNDVENKWSACIVRSESGEPLCFGQGISEIDAKINARIKYAEHLKHQEDLAEQTESVMTTRQPTAIDIIYSDIQEQTKLMTGLIEKAKREGLDGRLLAMANTDFERGFMALEKAITTNSNEG